MVNMNMNPSSHLRNELRRGFISKSERAASSSDVERNELPWEMMVLATSQPISLIELMKFKCSIDASNQRIQFKSNEVVDEFHLFERVSEDLE